MGILHISNITDIHRYTRTGSQRHVKDLLDRIKLTVGTQQDIEPSFTDRSDRTVKIFLLDRVHDLGDRKVKGTQFVEVQVNVNLSTQPATHLNLSYSLDALKTVKDVLLSKNPDLLGIHLIGSQGKKHDWKLRYIKLEDSRGLNVVRE